MREALKDNIQEIKTVPNSVQASHSEKKSKDNIESPQLLKFSESDSILKTEQILENKKSEQIKVLLEKTRNKLLLYREKFASQETLPYVAVNSSGIVALGIEGHVTIDWGEEPATLGKICPLIKILHAPIKVLQEKNYPQHDLFKGFLETQVRGIALKHWCSYRQLAEQCELEFEQFVTLNKKNFEDWNKSLFEDPDSYEQMLTDYLEAVEADKKVGPERPHRMRFVQSKEELIEEFEKEHFQLLVESQLEEGYKMNLLYNGFKMNYTVDHLIMLFEQAWEKIVYEEDEDSD